MNSKTSNPSCLATVQTPVIVPSRNNRTQRLLEIQQVQTDLPEDIANK